MACDVVGELFARLPILKAFRSGWSDKIVTRKTNELSRKQEKMRTSAKNFRARKRPVK